MIKKLSFFLLFLFVFFNISVNNVYAKPNQISDFNINQLKNLTYTDNTWLPESYLNGTYDNYAVFYVRLFGSSSSAVSRYLYVFCYNKSFGIEPFYLVPDASSLTGYNLKTVTQYSANNLSDVYGRWYRCYIQNSPSTVAWLECSNSASGFDYNASNVYLSVSHSTYKVSFLKYDYALNDIYRVDGGDVVYNDSSNRYTTYMTYLFGTSNFYVDDTLTDTLYSSNTEYDLYDDFVSSDADSGGSDIDYGSGGVFSWIGDFFKTLIDKVGDIPNAIGKFFDDLISVVISIPLTIIELLSNLLQFLFVPDSEFFSDIKDEFMENFEFAFQVIELGDSITPIFTDSSDSAPQFSITMYGKKMNIIDFSMFAQYRNFVHGIIVAIAYYKFIMWLIRNIPSVVHGFGTIERG